MVKIAGWESKALGELIDEGKISIQTGPFGTVLSASEFVKYGIPIVAVREIREGYIQIFDETPCVSMETYNRLPKYNLADNDLVFARKGNVERSALIPSTQSKYFLGSDGIRLRVINKSILPLYLFYAIQSNTAKNFLIQNAYGTTMAGLNERILSSIPLVLPVNVEEQSAIAEALSDVDNLISSLQKLIEKKKSIKQGAMQELLTGKKRLPGFGEQWSEASFADLFDFLPTNAFTRDQMTDTGTIHNIHYGDILTKYGACLDISNTAVPYLLETVSVKKYSESSYARNGDVIMADTAEDNTVGKCVELVNIRGKVLSGQHTMLCRPKLPFAPKFLGYYMNSGYFHDQMLPFITGIKVSSISKANVSALIFKYPSSVDEQEAIADVFSDMDSEIEQLEKKLAKYQQIKQGMMQELLTGRIRLVNTAGNEQPKRQAVQEKQPQPAHNQHFDDAVMIAGIVNAFHSPKYPLGRKKVQKLLYLVRRKEQADISAFHKKAAGPYADVVRYNGGEPIAQKNHYIQVKTSDKGSCFAKGEKMEQALAYLQDWGKQADIDWLVSQFQYTNVDELELLATVDMAMCDLCQEGIEVSVSAIKDLIRSNKEWRDKLKKTYFKDADIQRAIKRCRELFPDKEG